MLDNVLKFLVFSDMIMILEQYRNFLYLKF